MRLNSDTTFSAEFCTIKVHTHVHTHNEPIDYITDRTLTQAFITLKRLWIAYSKHEVLVFLWAILRHFINILVRDVFRIVLIVYATG
jgi:hypothetical protein